jgi:predicted transcriptional regulator
MILDEGKVSAILSAVAKYQTVNMLELMSLTPGLNDEDVASFIVPMEQNNLVKVSGSGDDSFVSLTNKGFDYLSSQSKLQLANATR